MSLYVAAFDETQNAAGDFTLGGFLAPEADWRNHFEPAWDERVLAGPPRIPHLHMTDIRNDEWRERHDLATIDASRRLDEAVRVIRSTGSLCPITASIGVGHFRALFSDPLQEMGGFGEIAKEPDYLSYIAFVTSTLHYTGKRIPEATRVAFLAENSQKTTRVLALFHEGLREALVSQLDFPHLLGEFSSGGKTSIPLQAADLLCWHLQRADADRLHPIDAARFWKVITRQGFRFEIEAAHIKELSDHLQSEMTRKTAEP